MEKRTSQRKEVGSRNVLLHHSIEVCLYWMRACGCMQQKGLRNLQNHLQCILAGFRGSYSLQSKQTHSTVQGLLNVLHATTAQLCKRCEHTQCVLSTCQMWYLRDLLAAIESTSLREAPITNRPITGHRFHAHAPQLWWREESSNSLSTSVSQFTRCRAALPLKTWDTCHSRCKRQESYKGLFPDFLFKLRIDLETSKSHPGHLSPSLPQGVFGPAWTRCKAYWVKQVSILSIQNSRKKNWPSYRSLDCFFGSSTSQLIGKDWPLQVHSTVVSTLGAAVERAFGRCHWSSTIQSWHVAFHTSPNMALRSQQSWSLGTSTYLGKLLKPTEATPQCVENQVAWAHPHLLRFHRLHRVTETLRIETDSKKGNITCQTAKRCWKEFCSSALFFPIPSLNRLNPKSYNTCLALAVGTCPVLSMCLSNFYDVKTHWHSHAWIKPLAGHPHSHTGRWSKRGGSCGVGTRLYSPCNSEKLIVWLLLFWRCLITFLPGASPKKLGTDHNPVSFWRIWVTNSRRLKQQ